MDILFESIVNNPFNVPKLKTETLQIKNNYFVVSDGESFNYYPIKLFPSSDTDQLIRFEKSPPVLLEGLVIVNKKAYYVTIDDLLRRIVRKSRELSKETINGNKDSTNGNDGSNSSDPIPAVSTSKSRAETIISVNEPGVGSDIEMEEYKIANTTWAEQIGTLLDSLSKEEGEEWEVENAA